MHQTHEKKNDNIIKIGKPPKGRIPPTPASQRMAHRNSKRLKTRHAKHKAALSGW